MRKRFLRSVAFAFVFLSSASAIFAQDGVEEGGGQVLQVLKKNFIDGDWRFMTMVLIVLIIGLALCIERIITINLASTNTNRLLRKIEGHLDSNDTDGAIDVARSTPGPAASVIYQGLKKVDEGPAAVEKAIVSNGALQMALLEKGLVWISLFIAIAPMLGFMGTVIGMIGAFNDIQAAGDLSPSVVAGGIKVALLTTVFGLIVAIILQIFYNYLVAKIDSITNSMEEASLATIDLLASKNVFK